MKLLLIICTALSALLTMLENKTLQSDVSITMQDGSKAPLTVAGKITMCGECFVGTARGYEVAYDGATFYMYDPDAQELELTHPTKEELMTVNPLLYAKYLSEHSDIQELTNKDGSVVTITLTPKQSTSELQKVVVKVKQSMPLSVEVKDSKSTNLIRFKNPHFLITKPVFKIVKDGAYINDLR